MIPEFDAGTHTYTLDGAALPWVTEIVAPLGGAPAPELDEETGEALTMARAAERGTLLHDYIARRLQGEAADAVELPEEYGSWADAVELFLAEHSFEPWLIEQPLACAEFAGTPDYVGLFDGRATILDWKFVSQLQKSRVSAQLAGYRALCAEEELEIERTAAVQFLPGNYRLYPVRYGTEAEKRFEACLYIRQQRAMKHPRGAIA